MHCKTKQEEAITSKTYDARTSIKVDRIAGILPYISYEESKRIYDKLHNEISAVMGTASRINGESNNESQDARLLQQLVCTRPLSCVDKHI